MEELNEEVVEETTEQTNEQPVEEVVEETIHESKFNSAGNDVVIKIDLDNQAPLKEKEEVTKVNIVEEPKAEEKEEIQEDIPVIEEVTMEDLKDPEIVEEKVEEIIQEEAPKTTMPESMQKLVDFMEETGGDIHDYVNLNRDVSKLDDSDVLD